MGLSVRLFGLGMIRMELDVRGRNGWEWVEWEGSTYVTRETGRRNRLIRPIKQTVKNIITVIDLLHISHRLNWWSKDQSRKKDSNGESWFLLFNEFPDCFLGLGFCDTVGDIRMLSFDGVFDCELVILVYTQKAGGGESTGSHSEEVKTLESMS